MPDTAEIPVEINGKPFVMKPTLAACIAISKAAGGLHGAVNRCAALDFETICFILQHGIGLNPKQGQLLQEEVFRNGVLYLSGPCISFIHIVSRGGKGLPDDGEDEGEDGTEAETPLSASH